MERSEIEEKTLELLTLTGVSDLPVDLEKIAHYLNINILYDELDDDVSGFLLVDGEKGATAVINNSHHQNRQRFTLAHEIGHFCLHVGVANEETIFVDKK